MTTILCIEDEAELRENIAEELQDAGYHVEEACDGREGLEMILKHQPDLVISDITMPRMNGHELLQEIREKHKKLSDMPFIFLSALADREDVRTGLKLGADDFLTKPIDLEVLVDRVFTRLRQVARMRESKEQQFVKLYNALSPGVETVAEATPDSDFHPETAKPATVKKPRTQAAPAAGTATQPSVNDKKQRKIFGSLFRFDNLNTMGDDLGSHRKGILDWAEARAKNILKNVLPAGDKVTTSPSGGVLVCYQNADRDQAAEQSKQLEKILRDNLQDDQLDGFAKTVSIPRKLLAHAVVVSQSLFETEMAVADVGNENRFLVAIEEQVEKMRTDKSAPKKLCASIKKDKGRLEPSALISPNERLHGISFLNYDDASQHKLISSFALFGDHNLTTARYLIDILTLNLLKSKIKESEIKGTVVVDVHFDTLERDKSYLSYLNEYMPFTRDIKNNVIVNVRNVPLDITDVRLDEILEPLGASIAKRMVQITPSMIETHTSAGLPVSCIVLSHPELMRSKRNLPMISKASQSLSAAGTSLILRDVPSKDEIPEFIKYGFNGLAVKSD